MKLVTLLVGIANLLIGGFWFLLLMQWSRSRPIHAEPSLGFVHYVKTPWAIVFLNNSDFVWHCSLQVASLVLWVVFFSSAWRWAVNRDERNA